jgi:hypothetical protein
MNYSICDLGLLQMATWKEQHRKRQGNNWVIADRRGSEVRELLPQLLVSGAKWSPLQEESCDRVVPTEHLRQD